MENERLDAVRQIAKDIISWEDFKIIKKIRFGPRYFIAEGLRNKQKCVFKICLYTDSIDHLTNEKFSREILFLNFIQYSKFHQVKSVTPRIQAFGLKPRAWYMREYLSGKFYNVNGGNIRFKKTFFTKPNLDWFVKTFTNLQSIKPADLPVNLKKFLYRPDFTRNLWRFISPHWQKIEQYMKWPGVSRLIKIEFTKYASIYNTAPQVLAHQEPYSCHFLRTQQRLHVIDWENIGWSNPNHDPVVLWMRAYNDPGWQKILYQKFRKKYAGYKEFDDLWIIEVLIQSVFNIISYYFYEDKKDIQEMVSFSDKKIREILTNTFKLYN
ncbi:MAG: hypothetical protein WC808_06420 [Patescibacteria group bacterium]